VVVSERLTDKTTVAGLVVIVYLSHFSSSSLSGYVGFGPRRSTAA
jgi:hypothetical protein